MGAAKELRSLLSKRVVFLDGAMGTMLMKEGMPPGACPERWAASNPRRLAAIHHAYARAGSDVVLSCTFGGTSRRLGEEPERLNTVLAECLLKATDGLAIPAASMGPTGVLMDPLGSMTWIEAYREFLSQAKALVRAGIEVFFLETFSDPRELKAAALAVRDACPDGFTSAQMSFDDRGTSLSGTSPELLAILAEQLPVDAVGANCSVGPDSLVAVAREIREHTRKPVSIEPNAGLPDNEGRHGMSPGAFASRCEDIVWSGASMIGGCCGTGPAHIRALRTLVGDRKAVSAPRVRRRALTSMTAVVHLGRELVLVGEGINPSGKRGLREAIRSGDTGSLLSMAGKQAGASVLDVNLGLERMIPEGFVSRLFSRLAAGPPLSVDLSDPDNIELAFRESGGIGVLNSLTCEREFMEKRLETLMRHGGYAVLLPIDRNGSAETPSERVELLRRGMAILKESGFPGWRVIADPIVASMASGADPDGTVKTLRRMKKRGWLTIAGVSNVSHGLPERAALNLAFLATLAGEGLDLAIVDVTRPETVLAARGGQILSGRIPPTMALEPFDDPREACSPLEDAIIRGDAVETLKCAGDLLASGTEPCRLVTDHLQKAMTRLGELYDRRKVFLPHLIAGAEAAQALTGLVKPLIGEGSAVSRGTIVLATVQGDVHDIGKNLVALFLESAGFRVVDLGRDVRSELIVRTAVEENASAVALSALMSSTASRMEEVVGLLRKEGLKIPVVVGGAVITGEFAGKIGARYAREAFGVVKALEDIAGV